MAPKCASKKLVIFLLPFNLKIDMIIFQFVLITLDMKKSSCRSLIFDLIVHRAKALPYPS